MLAVNFDEGEVITALASGFEGRFFVPILDSKTTIDELIDELKRLRDRYIIKDVFIAGDAIVGSSAEIGDYTCLCAEIEDPRGDNRPSVAALEKQLRKILSKYVDAQCFLLGLVDRLDVLKLAPDDSGMEKDVEVLTFASNKVEEVLEEFIDRVASYLDKTGFDIDKIVFKKDRPFQKTNCFRVTMFMRNHEYQLHFTTKP